MARLIYPNLQDSFRSDFGKSRRMFKLESSIIRWSHSFGAFMTVFRSAYHTAYDLHDVAVDAKDKDKRTLLSWAAQRGHDRVGSATC